MAVKPKSVRVIGHNCLSNIEPLQYTHNIFKVQGAQAQAHDRIWHGDKKFNFLVCCFLSNIYLALNIQILESEEPRCLLNT
jgi:hypothetical protein